MRQLIIVILGYFSLMFVTSCENSTKEMNESASENILNAETLDRSVLPVKNSFQGKMGETYKTSEQNFPKAVSAPKGAPNVVLIMLDDVGFGQLGVNGGLIPTPYLDQLSKEGLLYNNFHTTSVCSPTRAALMTGRNQHEVGFGTITEMSTGYPGYNSIIPKEAATLPEVLRLNGYNTALFGKWHNTPDWVVNQSGPMDLWPTGLGFEHFYGWFGGETSQYQPQLWRNTNPVEPPYSYKDGYHLTEDLTAQATSWVANQKALAPDKPYFMFFAPGAVHSPIHAPKEWIDKFKGQFDEGWDVYREKAFKRQKELGIIPENAKLTPRPESIPSWESMSEKEKIVYARQAEVVAGYLAHADHYIGEMLEEIKKLPGGDNTMIIYITGDNGASPEGSMTGTDNNMLTQNGLKSTIEAQYEVLDELGSYKHENHYGVPWSWAFSTPFQWMKRVASHYGGTKNSVIINYPDHISEPGSIREQFHHVIDIAPTIYEAANIPQPIEVNGATQMPMSGVSMQYTFMDKEAKGRRLIQYFETEGRRAIYHDGWIACAVHSVPWELINATGEFESDEWELYNVENDYSQYNNLAKDNPEKLTELKELFKSEARKYNVYPLDDRWAQRAMNPERPSVNSKRTHYHFDSGTRRLTEGSAPMVFQTSHTITADINIPQEGGDGVIVAMGGRTSGYTFYMMNGYLNYEYNWFTKEYYLTTSKNKITPGNHVVKMVYEQKPFVPFKDLTGGTVQLFVDDVLVGEGMTDKMVFGKYTLTETMDVGIDLGSSVSQRYEPMEPFEFNGKINYVDYDISPSRPEIINN